MAKAIRPRKSTENIHGAGRADASVGGLKRTFLDHLCYTQGRIIQTASLKDGYMALAYTVRDQLLHRWVRTVEKYLEQGIKVVSYLSAEFLLGPHLENNLINLGLYEEARKAVEEAGFDFQKLVRAGGRTRPGQRRPGEVGRLLPRFAGDLRNPGHRLRHPLRIRDFRPADPGRLAGGAHRPVASLGNPWEIARPEIAYR